MDSLKSMDSLRYLKRNASVAAGQLALEQETKRSASILGRKINFHLRHIQ